MSAKDHYQSIIKEKDGGAALLPEQWVMWPQFSSSFSAPSSDDQDEQDDQENYDDDVHPPLSSRITQNEDGIGLNKAVLFSNSNKQTQDHQRWI